MDIAYNYSKFDNLISKINYSKNSLDRKPRYFCEDSAKNDYQEYLKEKIKNPTQTEIATHEVNKQDPIKYPYYFSKNKRQLEKNPEIDFLQKQTDKIDYSHPRTQYLREMLIKNDQIKLHTVTPKLTGIKKILFILKAIF